jgi:hypothetical protein
VLSWGWIRRRKSARLWECYCLLANKKAPDELKHYISSWLPKFITPTGVMSVELINYHCKPEGGGVFQAYTNSQGAALIKSKTIALVMVGLSQCQYSAFRAGSAH